MRLYKFVKPGKGAVAFCAEPDGARLPNPPWQAVGAVDINHSSGPVDGVPASEIYNALTLKGHYVRCPG
jgi:hypothetical protein